MAIPLLTATVFACPDWTHASQFRDRPLSLVQVAQAESALVDEAKSDRFWQLIERGTSKAVEGDLPGALEHFLAAQALAEDRIAKDPSNPRWQRELAIGLNRVGEIRLAQGDFEGAKDQYLRAFAIRDRLVASDPSNDLWHRDLAVSNLHIGDLWYAAGDVERSEQRYRAALENLRDLAALYPDDAEVQSDLATGYSRIGLLRRAVGDLDGARESYRLELAIVEKLAALYPEDSQRQWDLLITCQSIGNVEYDRRHFGKSLRSHSKALELAKRLVAQDSTRTDWQDALQKSHSMVGDALYLLAYDDEKTLANYRASLSISEKLAERDPSNVDWQRSLLVNHANIAKLHDDGAVSRRDARRHLEEALRIALKLEASGRLLGSDAVIPDEIRERLAELP